jgi:hypothetical protein
MPKKKKKKAKAKPPTKAEKAEKARREADEMYNLMAVELRMAGLEPPPRPEGASSSQTKQVRRAQHSPHDARSLRERRLAPCSLLPAPCCSTIAAGTAHDRRSSSRRSARR